MLSKQSIPVYEKAKEIACISDTIFRSFMLDYETLDSKGREHPNIYILGDLIRDTRILSSDIERTDQQHFHYDKVRFALRTGRRSSGIGRRCKRLEKGCKSGRDYLKLLRGELLKFNKLQERWMQLL